MLVGSHGFNDVALAGIDAQHDIPVTYLRRMPNRGDRRHQPQLQLLDENDDAPPSAATHVQRPATGCPQATARSPAVMNAPEKAVALSRPRHAVVQPRAVTELNGLTGVGTPLPV
ncbi:hypothetical protein [Actinoplanes sp. ATCC 53533]|uniref:hypothetical protein n=1 Tax=Actinoplanes sp. ATCC 53533 TaxID=1288362 RepID=UPI000F7B0958|nr:hypothetical protein [Actinoplanes sp. ATCC 53533]